jgi:GT2 family glycosyltransferase
MSDSTRPPALIVMPSFITKENDRGWQAMATMRSISRTTDLSKHKLFVVDDNSEEWAKDIYQEFVETDPQGKKVEFIFNDSNVGTARSCNKAIAKRLPGQSAIKVDSDVEFLDCDWADRMEDTVARFPRINEEIQRLATPEMRDKVRKVPPLGVLGCKRIDLVQTPWSHPYDWWHSQTLMVPQKAGEDWLFVELTADVMGTAVMYTSDMLDKTGYMYQPSKYSWDDHLLNMRAEVAGFCCGFVHTVRIRHIDPGTTPYQKWKEKEARITMPEHDRLVAGYKNGTISVYYDENGNQPS